MSIKNNIKQLRKQNKITQKQLGEMIGKKERTIQKYESGEIIPPIEVLRDMSQAFNCTLSKLLFSDDELKNGGSSDISSETRNEVDKIKINSFLDFVTCLGLNEFKDLSSHQLLNIIDSKSLFNRLSELFNLEIAKANLNSINESQLYLDHLIEQFDELRDQLKNEITRAENGEKTDIKKINDIKYAMKNLKNEAISKGVWRNKDSINNK